MKTLSLRSMLCVAAASLLLTTLPSSAAPCAGFTDVDDTSAFCKNVEWLKNRGITLGCMLGKYCPADVVTRSAMATFLNRLGNALTPGSLSASEVSAALDLDATATICKTPFYAPSGAPRSAHGEATFVGGKPSVPADMFVQIVESTDGGSTWNPVSPGHAVTASGFTSQPSVSVFLAPRDLAVGTSYRYAVRMGRVPGSATTGDVGTGQCQLRVMLENRNAATSPLDQDD